MIRIFFASLTLLFVLLAAINAAFIKSIENLPDPCIVRNLTVVSSVNGRVLSNHSLCKAEVPQKLLTRPPLVNFTHTNFKQFANSKFVLFGFDATKNKLLWAVSNLTSRNAALIPSQRRSPLIHKPYEAIIIQPPKKYHNFILVVLEDKHSCFNVSLMVNENRRISFNFFVRFYQFINSVEKVCELVAATELLVYDSKISTIHSRVPHKAASKFLLHSHLAHFSYTQSMTNFTSQNHLKGFDHEYFPTPAYRRSCSFVIAKSSFVASISLKTIPSITVTFFVIYEVGLFVIFG